MNPNQLGHDFFLRLLKGFDSFWLGQVCSRRHEVNLEQLKVEGDRKVCFCCCNLWMLLHYSMIGLSWISCRGITEVPPPKATPPNK